MTSSIGALAALFLFGQTAAAVDDAPSITFEDIYAMDANPAIWKVGDDDTTIYLFGTIHVLMPDLEWQTPKFHSILSDVDVLYTEVNLGPDADVFGEMAALMDFGILPVGQTIHDFYSDDEQRALNDNLSILNCSLDCFARTRPWLASVEVSYGALTAIGGEMDAGIEMVLVGWAEGNGVPIRGLETPREQMAMVTSASDEEWAAVLVETIAELDNIESVYAPLIASWYTGDAQALGEQMDADFAHQPSIGNAILYLRNEAWAETLNTLIESEEGVFLVAVGGAHLVGQNSVQDYLATYGYTTERINP